ncbi:hypothetical protein RHGRI_033298 [Rhododendron griersonianum]|uniref:Exostosin GT47 domain-containing protein n=1 Tax=Rhododendron griersonianum TaxID=479676 RepID=A0AAV6I1V9_9ERIC|nr:hypothetical protein RHGRI_033298 [Rhododendron griersonianum]
MKLFGKTVLSLIAVLILTLTYAVFIGTLDVRSHFYPLLNITASAPCRRNESLLRVYMYDLPRRFNVGMLDRRSSDETPVTARTLPAWPGRSGLRKQHSAEYWMMASLLCEGEDPTREAVDVLKFLRDSNYWQRSAGRDHVIPMNHPNAFRYLREEVNASILIVADFGRYPKIMANLNKDVVAPYVHVVDSFTDDDPPDPYGSRSTLIFFKGTTVRKDEGKVRAKLAKILVGYEDVHYENSHATGESIKASTEGMRLSKFCLHPAGDTPSSCRLFDAIVSHCVPVIVSDQIELPYEDELDYTQFSVFFSVKEALEPGYLVTQLRQFPKERWLEMWRRLKSISHHFEFQYPPKKEDGVNMIWRQVKHKVPAAKLAVHRSQRLKVPDWWRRRR